MKEINNAKAFSWFLSCVIGGSLLNALPVLFNVYDGWLSLIPYTIYGCILALILIIRPNYVSFQFLPNQVNISTGISEETVMKIAGNDYADYKLTPGFRKYTYTIVFYRQVAKGYLQSRPIRITLMSAAQIAAIEASLEQLKTTKQQPPLQ